MITRAQLEKAVVATTRESLLLSGFAVTDDGTNADLNEPIAQALDYFGVRADDRSLVDSDDLARLDDSLEPVLVAAAKLAVLKAGLLVLATRPQSQSWSSYKEDFTNGVQQLTLALAAAQADFDALFSRASGVRVGRMAPANRDELRDERRHSRRRWPRGGLVTPWDC